MTAGRNRLLNDGSWFSLYNLSKQIKNNHYDNMSRTIEAIVPQGVLYNNDNTNSIRINEEKLDKIKKFIKMI